jgi:haloacetate dehalogenase
VLETWKVKAANIVTGTALPCGHLLPEEQPDLALKHFRDFFQA